MAVRGSSRARLTEWGITRYAHPMNTRPERLALVVLISLFGCAQSSGTVDAGAVGLDSQAQPDASQGQPDASQGQPDASQGQPDGTTSTNTIGPAGGTITFDGVTLVVPSGALAMETMISIRRSSESVPPGVTALSPLYLFEPAGLAFSMPVQVAIQFTGSPPAPELFWSRVAGAGFDHSAGVVAGDVLTGQALHFSTGFVGVLTGTATPSGESCATAIPLTDGVLLRDQTASRHTDDHRSRVGPCFARTPDPDVVYSFVVPPGKQAHVSFPETTAALPLLTLVPGPVANCSANDQCSGASRIGQAAYTNMSASPQTVFAVVDVDATRTGGRYNILFRLSDPLPGDSCGNADTLPTDGTAVSGTLEGYSNELTTHSGGCSLVSSLDGIDRVYEVAVPAGEVLRVQVTPDHFDATITLFKDCETLPLSCVASANNKTRSGREVALYVNDTAMTETLFVVVEDRVQLDRSREHPPGRHFEIAATLHGAGSSVALGDNCAGAAAVTPPMLLNAGPPVGLRNDSGTRGAGCNPLGDPLREDGVYAVDVPNLTRLSVSVLGAENLLFVTESCPWVTGSPSCIAPNPTRPVDTITTEYTNVSGATMRVYVLIDGLVPTIPVTVLAVLQTSEPVATPVETCSGPALPSNQRWVGSLQGLADDFSAAIGPCQFGAGGDGVFAISVPSQQRLTLDVVPVSSFDGQLSLLPSCTGPCLSSSSYVPYASEFAGWTNITSSSVTIYAALDTSAMNSQAQVFEIVSRIEPPPAGETCATAIPIAPGVVFGSLATFSREMTPVAGCGVTNPPADEAADAVYAINVPAGKQLTVGTGGVVQGYLVHSLADCSPTPACVGSFNAAHSDGTYTNSSGGPETIFIVLSGVSGSQFILTTQVSP